MKSNLRRACVLTISLTVAIGLAQPAAASLTAAGETSAYGWQAQLYGTGVPDGEFAYAPGPQVAGSGEANARKAAYGKDFAPAGAIGFGTAESSPASEQGADRGLRGAEAAAKDIVLFEGTPAELRIDSVVARCVSRKDAATGRVVMRGGQVAGNRLPDAPAPNTTIMVRNPASELPLGALILNQQIRNQDGSLTVHGAKYVVHIPASVGGIGDPERDTYASGALVLASATCA